MLARAGQCGVDTARAGCLEVQAVATMDCPKAYEHLDISESVLYSASTLHLHGLPFDYDALRVERPPDECHVCRTALVDHQRPTSLHDRLFTWQSHMARCGGDGRRTHAHEMAKLAVKRLALCNPDPGGVAIPPNQLIIEARNLRSDASRPGDLYVVAGGTHAKDAAMDIVITSAIAQSCLLQSSSSSDYAIRLAENNKFSKDLRNKEPIQLSRTQRFIPLAMNQCGRRGPHFNAVLREHASLLINRPSGYNLLRGPFAVPPTVALAKVLSAWGMRITWTVQREYAAQIVRAVDTHKAAAHFCVSANGGSVHAGGTYQVPRMGVRGQVSGDRMGHPGPFTEAWDCAGGRGGWF